MEPANSGKKRAVVFGATGMIGQELTIQLIKNTDYEAVIAVTRRKLPVTDQKLEQVLITDYSELPGIKDRLIADQFYCCIGTTIKKAGSQEVFKNTDYGIPLIISQTAETLSVPSLVVISSIGADSRSSNFYLRTKGEMEKAVRKAYSGHLKFIRPSLLMGKRVESRFGEKAAVVFMNLFGWLFAGPLRKYRGIRAEDVASAMIKISDLPSGQMIYESDALLYIASEK